MKILLLEDDYLYNISVKEFLEELNFHVDAFEDGEEALDAIYENYYDLLLLDIRVPKMSGFELIENIRENSIKTPVIIFTSLTDISSLSKGYELGCNDYLKKPFDLLELKYRIEQLIKFNCFESSKELIKLKNNYTFDIKNELLYKDKEPIELSQKESEVISYLIQSRGRYISIETLHENIWSNKDILYADIRMCIKRIRDKTDKEFIITKRFVGYKVDK